MAEILAGQASSLAAQLAVYLPVERANQLAELLTDLRAGRIDPTVAQARLANDGPLLEAVHRLAARAVTLQIAGSALGVMFGKDADLRIATITIGDVVRHTSAVAGGHGGGEDDSGMATYHAVFHLPPAARRLLACQSPYPADQLLIGREREMQVLAAQLLLDAPVAPPPVVLTGPSGVGKSALAAAFAHQQRQAFPGGVFWIRMGQPEEIALQVASCGGPGGLDLPGWAAQSFDAQVEAVYAAWQHMTPRLLVLEDVSDAALLARWAPHGGGCRVIGTALAWPEPGQALSLGPLPRAASLQLLLDGRARNAGVPIETLLADRAQVQVANAICDELDDLPLAVALAGAALASQQRQIALPAYFGRMAQVLRGHVAALSGLRAATMQGEERKVGGAFLLTIELIRAQGSVGVVAQDLLRRAAQSAPAPLPGDLLPRLVGIVPESGKLWDDATAALRLLQQLGFLVAIGEYVWMHDVIARLARMLLPPIGDDHVAVERAVIASAKTVYNSQQPWEGMALVPHLAHAAQASSQRVDDRAATLLLNLGYLLQNLGDLKRARPAYEQALAICIAVLGNNHAATARILINLGRLLQDQGDFAGAQEHYERALAINEQIVGPHAPPTARTLHRLGRLREVQSDFAGARGYYERELYINEQVFGTDHPDTASSMITLGHMLQEQGEYSQARNLYERALEVCEQVLGQQHPATARSLHALGMLCEQQGDTWSARRAYERALAIREITLGPQHPDTARSLHTLGYLFHLQDEFEMARSHYERALAIREKVLGPQHPDTGSTLNNMAHLSELEGDLVTAQHLYERALLICMQNLGPEHPNTVVVRTNLAELEARLREG